MPDASSEVRTMVTLRRGDGEDLFDEFSHMEVTARDPWDDADEEAVTHYYVDHEDNDEPITYVVETWQLVTAERRDISPREAHERLNPPEVRDV